ncbi:MAG TPA: S8 family serine peptidase, partial [Pyrinomonadaceae bacterium]|nr:S8 family serine peptidase [Pyrinomonadaceae bacterium]
DLAHHLVRGGMGVSGLGQPQFVEPDLEQRWLVSSDPQLAFATARTCDQVEEPDSRLPTGDGPFWFRDASHSQLERARGEVGEPGSRVRIAHLDTGYDRAHVTLPRFLRTDLQKNFVDEDRPDDATDRSSGLITNLGHGTGTLSILAGAAVDGVPLGGAAFLEVIPVRVADSVVLFKNSAIARAFDYVHSLAARADARADVITMSMGGLASQAWAEAVNALYEAGVFVVTAAGNNFGNLPTHNIVYPARFKRVVAACGVMADGTPYADLSFRIMAGNYGPASKMETALAAYTPNTPWARLGCSRTVDHDGRGTSAATPQVASAAALWIQKNRDRLGQYPEQWMRVEAVREALFGTARLSSHDLRERLGNGIVQASTALSHAPASAASLAHRKQPEDSVSFPFFRVLTGFGAAAPDARQRMLELEALQLTQRSHELERLLPDPSVEPVNVSEKNRRTFAEALADTPGASAALRESVGLGDSRRRRQVAVPQEFNSRDAARVKKAMEPPLSEPVTRRLRVFAYDPLLGTKLDTVGLNETTLEVRWEKDLAPGPVGEYLEVVDVDPATGACYAPVDLNHPLPLSQAGLSPSEASPRFHQQMVYAVAMKTIEHFEYALGRVALWAPRFVRTNGGRGGVRQEFVRRLRVYPHAIREENSFYSPEKKALLFGYFTASDTDPGENLPGQTVFCCLSHDIVAHETTHALLDGLHRRFHEPTNEDVLAFHEAFADIVALFQHFTVPEALRSVIARTRGDLGQQNMLGQLAQQFGQATGTHGALRDAIGRINEQTGRWEPTTPTVNDYQNATEPHDRGAVLVAAIFEAFLSIYRLRSEDLVRLATGGTGVLPPGAISHDLVLRLSQEASKAASHVLNICIRALDYCPPVDITFGDYVRALVTADRDLVPDDDRGYRVAFIQAFRRRGIYPQHVRSLTTESVCWDSPELDIPIARALDKMTFKWDLHAKRKEAYDSSRANAAILHNWISQNLTDEQTLALGFYRSPNARAAVKALPAGRLSNFEVHSVRPVRRVGPDDQQQLDLVVEITQSWRPDGRDGEVYRGGSTLIIDLEKSRIRYCIRKRVANAERVDKQRGFRMALDAGSLRNNYFTDSGLGREPFALIHRGL